MPTYEYVCENCNYQFEREQRITADPIKTCPKCKARKVKRLITQGNFILKGAGWYADAYSGPSNNAGSSEKKPSTPPKADAAADKKPSKAPKKAASKKKASKKGA